MTGANSTSRRDRDAKCLRLGRRSQGSNNTNRIYEFHDLSNRCRCSPPWQCCTCHQWLDLGVQLAVTQPSIVLSYCKHVYVLLKLKCGKFHHILYSVPPHCHSCRVVETIKEWRRNNRQCRDPSHVHNSSNFRFLTNLRSRSIRLLEVHTVACTTLPDHWNFVGDHRITTGALLTIGTVCFPEQVYFQQSLSAWFTLLTLCAVRHVNSVSILLKQQIACA